MISNAVIGNISSYDTTDKTLAYLDFDWFDLNKKIHRKMASDGHEVGIHLGDNILRHGLRDGDILCQSDTTVYCVKILPCEVLEIEVKTTKEWVKAAYEVGNRHAPLFFDSGSATLVTPYNEPMEVMFQKLHFHTKRSKGVLDFTQEISAQAGHHHGHHHDHG